MDHYYTDDYFSRYDRLISRGDRGGFGYLVVRRNTNGYPNPLSAYLVCSVMAPDWFLVLLTGIAPALWIARRARRWQDRRSGRCLACGYDLTGNVSGTCPECGATFAAASVPPAATLT